MIYDPTKDFIVERLRIRATTRRLTTGRLGEDRLANLLEEAADVIEYLVLNTKKKESTNG